MECVCLHAVIVPTAEVGFILPRIIPQCSQQIAARGLEYSNQHLAGRTRLLPTHKIAHQSYRTVLHVIILTLYMRKHCHLCDEMRRALEPYCLNRNLELRQLDVDEDPVLMAQYSDAVPLLAMGDDEICRYQLDAQALLEQLGETQTKSEAQLAGKSSGYARIYEIVRQIPRGQIATYGQIAKIEGHVTARMVGYAMNALGAHQDVPWQRVINSLGRLSDRKGGGGYDHQRRRLETEGVFFNPKGCVDFDTVGWPGPDPAWLERHQCFLAPPPCSKRRRYLGR